MRRLFSISTLLQTFAALMTLVLVALLALQAVFAWEKREQARLIPKLIEVASDLSLARQNYRVERGTVNAALVTTDPVDRETGNQIRVLRTNAEAALDSALTKLKPVSVADTLPAVQTVEAGRRNLLELRVRVDAALGQDNTRRSAGLGPSWLDAEDRIVTSIEQLSRHLEGRLSSDDSFIASMIKITQIVWLVRSESGDDRLQVREAMVSARQFGDEQRIRFAQRAGRIQGAWRIVQEQTAAAGTPSQLKISVAEVDRLYFNGFLLVRNRLVDELADHRPTYISPREWLDLSVPSRQAMFEVSQTAFDLATARAVAQAANAERMLRWAIFSTVLFSAMGALFLVYVIRRVIRPIARITESMRLVAGGDLDCDIPFKDRSDEIGSLSQALRVFRNDAIMRQQLEIAKIRAETASRTKSEFLATMSHELRTPLNAIIGFSDVMQKNFFGPLSERYRLYATDIFNSGTHLLGLINEILDLSKLEAGQLKLYEEDVDLGEVLGASMRLVAPQADKAKVELSKMIDRDLHFIRADDRRLRQVIINLLSNAVKFTPEGGRVRLSCARKDGKLAIIVSDTGIGMEEEEIPRALEPFGQIDSSLSRKYDGTGLGLPLAKCLVELHGGTLTIESLKNAGTVVSVLLPGERVLRPVAQSEHA